MDSGEGTQQSSYRSHTSEGMTASIEIDMFSTDRDCNLDHKTFIINLFKNHTYLISIADDDLLLVTVKSLHHHGHDGTRDPWVFSVFVDWSTTCVHDHSKNASDGSGSTCLFWYLRCDPVQEGIVYVVLFYVGFVGLLIFNMTQIGLCLQIPLLTWSSRCATTVVASHYLEGSSPQQIIQYIFVSMITCQSA